MWIYRNTCWVNTKGRNKFMSFWGGYLFFAVLYERGCVNNKLCKSTAGSLFDLIIFGFWTCQYKYLNLVSDKQINPKCGVSTLHYFYLIIKKWTQYLPKLYEYTLGWDSLHFIIREKTQKGANCYNQGHIYEYNSGRYWVHSSSQNWARQVD